MGERRCGWNYSSDRGKTVMQTEDAQLRGIDPASVCAQIADDRHAIHEAFCQVLF